MNKMSWDKQYDTIVVGSGGGGLAAALTAAKEGARTLIIEKAPGLGGSTLFSGGLIWIPNNHLMNRAGIPDSIEEALSYMRTCLGDRGDEDRWRAFLSAGPEMIKYMEKYTPLRFKIAAAPDSFAEKTGGKVKGRNIEPYPLNPKMLGGWKKLLIDNPFRIGFPVTLGEAFSFTMASTNPLTSLIQKLKISPRYLWRKFTDKISLGSALVTGLLWGCRKTGVEVMLNTPALDLIVDEGKIVGIEARHEGKKLMLHAKRGVILATGGFEWNNEMVAEYLPGPIDYPVTTPYCTGDGHLMAQRVGAKLSRMNENMCWSAGYFPGRQDYHGAALGLLINSLLNNPHCIMVNRNGKRFVNEASHNAAQSYFKRDPLNGQMPNNPAWSIFDSQWRSKYAETEMGLTPGSSDPDWLIKAESLEELAIQTGIDPPSLVDTVARFNRFALNGKDLDFHRGEFAYDWHFVPRIKPNPNLGTIEKPPFCAVRVYTSTVGTKGGPMTDHKWRVLAEDGSVIQGLYAVGILAANIIGPITIAASSSIGQIMTQGYIAGRDVVYLRG